MVSGGALKAGEGIRLKLEWDRWVPAGEYPYVAVATTPDGTFPTPGTMRVTEDVILRIKTVLTDSRHTLFPLLLIAELVVLALTTGLLLQHAPTAPAEPRDHKEMIALCVRFFVVAECGARERKGDGEGLLKGVSYGGKNFGRVSDDTIAKIKALLDAVNEIWAQCIEHCCWIRFFLCEEDGKACVYALDPRGVPATYKNPVKIPYKPTGFVSKYWNATKTRTVDLCQFFDTGTKRDITTNRGGKDGKIEQSVTWDEDVGKDYKKGGSADKAIQERID